MSDKSEGAETFGILMANQDQIATFLSILPKACFLGFFLFSLKHAYALPGLDCAQEQNVFAPVNAALQNPVAKDLTECKLTRKADNSKRPEQEGNICLATYEAIKRGISQHAKQRSTGCKGVQKVVEAAKSCDGKNNGQSKCMEVASDSFNSALATENATINLLKNSISEVEQLLNESEQAIQKYERDEKVIEAAASSTPGAVNLMKSSNAIDNGQFSNITDSRPASDTLLLSKNGGLRTVDEYYSKISDLKKEHTVARSTADKYLSIAKQLHSQSKQRAAAFKKESGSEKGMETAGDPSTSGGEEPSGTPGGGGGGMPSMPEDSGSEISASDTNMNGDKGDTSNKSADPVNLMSDAKQSSKNSSGDLGAEAKRKIASENDFTPSFSGDLFSPKDSSGSSTLPPLGGEGAGASVEASAGGAGGVGGFSEEPKGEEAGAAPAEKKLDSLEALLGGGDFSSGGGGGGGGDFSSAGEPKAEETADLEFEEEQAYEESDFFEDNGEGDSISLFVRVKETHYRAQRDGLVYRFPRGF